MKRTIRFLMFMMLVMSTFLSMAPGNIDINELTGANDLTRIIKQNLKSEIEPGKGVSPIEIHPHTKAVNILLPGDLVITEILMQPLVPFGEFIEVYNDTALPIDMQGYTIADPLNGLSFSVTTSVIVLPGDYAVFAASANPALNGGFVADYEWPPSFSLHDFLGSIDISDTVMAPVDNVTYNPSTHPIGFGNSTSLSPDFLDEIANDSGDNFCISNNTPTPLGTFATPGMANDTCVDPIITIDLGPALPPCDCCCCDEMPAIGRQDGPYGG